MTGEELFGRLEDWLAVREAEGCKPSTIRNYRQHSSIFIKWLGERELTPVLFATFFRDYALSHSPASCRSVYTATRIFLTGIGRRDLVGTMRRPRGDTPPKAAYTEGQLRALFQVLRGDRTATGRRDYAIVCLLRYCGLRASEVCNLSLDDLGDEAVVVQRGKTIHARRTLPLIPPTPQALASYMSYGRRRLVRGDTTRVFLTQSGGSMTRNTLRMLLRRRSEQVGFPLSAHRFRHTWATAHVRARTSPAMIGYMAGWSPKTLYDMMARYSHPDLDDLRKAQHQAFS